MGQFVINQDHARSTVRKGSDQVTTADHSQDMKFHRQYTKGFAVEARFHHCDQCFSVLKRLSGIRHPRFIHGKTHPHR